MATLLGLFPTAYSFGGYGLGVKADEHDYLTLKFDVMTSK